MEKSNKYEFIFKIILFGAIWGVIEATIGYILHFLPPTVAGLIMFPIATLILVKAHKTLNSKSAILFIGLIAASIKAIDFLLPMNNPFKVINPMLSIVLESLVVIAFIAVISKKKITHKFTGGILSSVMWRMLFVGYMIVQFLISGAETIYVTSIGFSMNFILLSGVLSGVLVGGVLVIEDKVKFNNRKKLVFKPLYAILTLIIAISLQYLL